MNRTKNIILEEAKKLVNSINDLDFKTIKLYAKNSNGNDLTDTEIANFLINTGLYRLKFNDGEIYTYSTNVNFFNINNGNITIDTTALNGDIITHTFKYINTGANEYFILEETQEPTKEKIKYPIETNLANGEIIEFDDQENDVEAIVDSTFIGTFVNSNGTVYYEILKESIPDFMLLLENYLKEITTSLKNVNKDYNMTWNTDFSEINIFCEEDIKSKVVDNLTYLKLFACSMLKQVVNGNSDWHLTINYYNYNKNELFSSETLR